MSYLTYFTLIVKEDPKEQEEQFFNEIRELRTDDNIYDSEAFEDTWYNHMSDMLNLSEKYPEMSIVLYGDGEDINDRWIAYFKNGRGEKFATDLEYPDFDMETFDIKKYEVKVFLGEDAVDEYARNVDLPANSSMRYSRRWKTKARLCDARSVLKRKRKRTF